MKIINEFSNFPPNVKSSNLIKFKYNNIDEVKKYIMA